MFFGLKVLVKPIIKILEQLSFPTTFCPFLLKKMYLRIHQQKNMLYLYSSIFFLKIDTFL